MLSSGSEYQVHDTHKTRLLNHFQPDYTITRKDATVSWSQAVFFIEIKGTLVGRDLYDAIGEIHERLHMTFGEQTKRQYGYSAVTDFDQSFMLLFCKQNEDEGEFLSWKQTKV